jgi:hypothetical protein
VVPETLTCRMDGIRIPRRSASAVRHNVVANRNLPRHARRDLVVLLCKALGVDVQTPYPCVFPPARTSSSPPARPPARPPRPL